MRAVTFVLKAADQLIRAKKIAQFRGRGAFQAVKDVSTENSCQRFLIFNASTHHCVPRGMMLVSQKRREEQNKSAVE